MKASGIKLVTIDGVGKGWRKSGRLCVRYLEAEEVAGPFIADQQEEIQPLYQKYRGGKMEHISVAHASQKNNLLREIQTNAF